MIKTLAVLLSLCLVYQAQAATAYPDAIDGVRYDVHSRSGGYYVVARGRVEHRPEQLARLLEEFSQSLCAGAVTRTVKQAEYDFVEGGTSFLLPAAGILMPTTTYHWLKKAPLLAVELSCPEATVSSRPQTTEVRLRLIAASNLGDKLTYLDQGFANMIRERMEVPVEGPSFSQIAIQAMADALRERGYVVEVVAPGEGAPANVLISQERSGRENFSGVSLMTKIGLLGLQKGSYAFCSASIQTPTNAAGERRILGTISTVLTMDAIYASWAEDMRNGPSPEVHSRSYSTLASIVRADIAAATYAMSAGTVRTFEVSDDARQITVSKAQGSTE